MTSAPLQIELGRALPMMRSITLSLTLALALIAGACARQDSNLLDAVVIRPAIYGEDSPPGVWQLRSPSQIAATASGIDAIALGMSFTDVTDQVTFDTGPGCESVDGGVDCYKTYSMIDGDIDVSAILELDKVVGKYHFVCGASDKEDECTLTRVSIVFYLNHYYRLVDTATERYGTPTFTRDEKIVVDAATGERAHMLMSYWEDENSFAVGMARQDFTHPAMFSFGLASEMTPEVLERLKNLGTEAEP